MFGRNTQSLDPYAAQAHYQRELEANRAMLERQHQRSIALNQARADWAAIRDAKRSDIASLHSAIQSAESKMDTAPLDEAAAAAGERMVLERRLQLAENDFASHMRTQPA